MKKNSPAFLSLLVYLLIVIGIERLSYLQLKIAQSSFDYEKYFLIYLAYWPVFVLLTLIYQWIIFEKFPANNNFHIIQIVFGVIWYLLIFWWRTGISLGFIGRIIVELSMLTNGVVNAAFAMIAGFGVVGLLKIRKVKIID